MSDMEYAQVNARPLSEIEHAVQKATEERKMGLDAEIVDPSTVDSLISMLLGQQESLIRTYASLEAKLSPVISGGSIMELHDTINRPEYRSAFGERLSQIYVGYHELEQRIGSLTRNLNV